MVSFFCLISFGFCLVFLLPSFYMCLQSGSSCSHFFGSRYRLSYFFSHRDRFPILTFIFLIEIGTGPDSDYYIFDGNHTISPDVIPAKAGIYVEGGGVDSKSCLLYAHFDRAGELKFLSLLPAFIEAMP